MININLMKYPLFILFQIDNMWLCPLDLQFSKSHYKVLNTFSAKFQFLLLVDQILKYTFLYAK